MDRKEALRLLMKGTAAERKQRLDHPLVRYNDLGQIVCKLCNTVVKSEAAWNTHLVSRSHKETVARLKSRAAAAQKSQAAQAPPPQPGNVRKASDLPTDFFEAPKGKQPKGVPGKPAPAVPTPSTAKPPPEPTAASAALPPGFFDDNNRTAVVSKDGGTEIPRPKVTPAERPAEQQTKKDPGQKGVLPKGFFDDKEKDHRARGEEAPKLDINEEWKQFQKSVQVDIAEVDVRQEEEEAEAADEREERENIQQKTFLQHIQDLKRQKEAREKEKPLANVAQHTNGDVVNEESASGSDNDEDFSLHWRAKRV